MAGLPIATLGVVGSGQMGAGIAQVAAVAGAKVLVQDVSAGALEKARASIARSLAKLVEKGKVDAAVADAAQGRIEYTPTLDALAGCDLIVEAVVEDRAVKEAVFKSLDALAAPAAILATNTSSIPVTAIAAVTKRPAQVIGMHFMNPVPLMPLVEVIRGHLTSDETTALVVSAAKAMGKVPVEVQDYPGFVSNRVLLPMINEAVQCVMEGVATPEAIDQVMKLGMNHPMGPLALADLIGLDTCLAVMEVLHEGLGDDKYRPSPLLRRMVQAGLLGRKSGRGFYAYER
jgi:3-hydroxybutyryl-CoA dehydrogenase